MWRRLLMVSPRASGSTRQLSDIKPIDTVFWLNVRERVQQPGCTKIIYSVWANAFRTGYGSLREG